MKLFALMLAAGFTDAEVEVAQREALFHSAEECWEVAYEIQQTTMWAWCEPYRSEPTDSNPREKHHETLTLSF